MSLCRSERETAEAFAASTGMSWLMGYGADITVETLVGVAPCVFVIDRDGRIAWNDDRARFRHQVAAFRSGLRSALEELLSKPAPE